MRKWIFIFFSLMIIGACAGKKKKPSGVLSQDKMRAVVWDMMRADQYLMNYVFIKDTSDNKKEKSIQLYTQILSLHDISKDQFQKSLTYYRSQPELIQSIMDSISKRSEMPAIDTSAKPLPGTGIPGPETRADKKDSVRFPLRNIVVDSAQ